MSPPVASVYTHELKLTMALAERSRNSKIAACEWRWWVRELHSYFKAVHENNTKVQRALMLHLGGSELFEIYQQTKTVMKSWRQLKRQSMNTLNPSQSRQSKKWQKILQRGEWLERPDGENTGTLGKD